MTRHALWLTTFPLVLAAGCTSTAPLEDRIQEITWKMDATARAAEKATVDKRLAERELEIARTDNRVLKERLAIAYDAVRDAKARLDERLADRITELSESNPDQKLLISQYGGVVLESGILFTPGQHTLSKAGQAALDPLVVTLLKEDYDGYEIELAGHTDADPIKHSKRRYRDNWDLAAMRANSVRGYLVQNGISSDRIMLSSWGSARPIDPEQKSSNRRVEIVLHPMADEGGSLPASAPRGD